MYTLIHALQGARYLTASIKQKLNGPTRYTGNADDICKQILTACWNGTHYNVSPFHYQEFWARDFGYCAESLAKLGHRDKIKQTLAYALKNYQKTGIKTTISRENRPFSFPNTYSPDSVALTIHALRIAKDEELIETNEKFLQSEIDTYAHVVLDEGKVRQNMHFSGMRDYAVRNSSCYDHCMSILLARETKKLGFQFPYTEKELVKNLDDYWTGMDYRDDRTSITPTGDANTLPYWLGIGKNFKRTLKTMQYLDKPVPLAYTTSKQKMIHLGILVPNWENNNVWPFLGLLWAQTAKKHSPKLAKKYKQAYKNIIQQYGTLYEVYTREGKPYKSFFYHADESMIWAGNYLTL